MRRRLLFVTATVGWLLALVIGMAAMSRPRIDLLVVGGALGLLSFGELAAPVSIRPAWQRRFGTVRIVAVLFALAVIAPRVYDLVTY